MHDKSQFFTFFPTQAVINYMDFYINQEASGYDCFSRAAGGAIPERARQLMKDDHSPDTVSRVCRILDDTIEEGGEKDTQFLYFTRYFLPYFSNLMVGEFFDVVEEEKVFLARGDDTITYDQLEAAWNVIRDPSVKFAAEMGIDIWQELYGVVNNDHNVGPKVFDIISHGKNADMYRDIIFDAAAASDNYIIPALVNIFLDAYEEFTTENPSNGLDADDEDEDDYDMA